MRAMERVIVLGRGGAGKSTAGTRLGKLIDIPVIELDKLFWRPGLPPLPKSTWTAMQQELAKQSRWIMDGDLGPYDVLSVRIAAADTVLLLDFPLWLCAWRALRRDKEKWDFWWWVVTWGWRERPKIWEMFANNPSLSLHVFRSPKDLERFLTNIAPSSEPQCDV